jgi:hypothetical protein
MIVRNSLGTLYNNLNATGGGNIQSPSTGRVFHIVIDENSIGYTDWSSIGNVYFVGPVETPPSLPLTLDILSQYSFAKPFFSFNSYIPLIDELILLLDLPPANSSEVQNAKQLYYLSSINLFNSVNHNSQGVYNVDRNNNINLGNSIEESSNVKNLFPFEGDHILYGRWGQSLRFSSTLKFNETENFWSKVGNNGEPITLLVNGHKSPTNSLKPYVENINNDYSSIYLTSSQLIPLSVSKLIDQNPLTSPINPTKYSNSQIIISSERITLNSRKDEIMLHSNTNIELGATQVIHLNSSNSILLNSPKIYLGLNSTGKTPTEPALLGAQTVELLDKLLEALNNFASDIRTSPSPYAYGVHASTLFGRLNVLRGKLNSVYSETVFISK